MICERCFKEHNGEYGSGRFCSSYCARGFSTYKNRKEINDKVSKKLKSINKKYIEKCFCKYCNKEISFKNKSKICPDCSRTSDNVRNKISNAMKNRVSLGVHSGWHINNKPSRFEVIVRNYLDEIGLLENKDYICEYKISKSLATNGLEKDGAYRLDFYFPSKSIAIELDGKQHRSVERSTHDKLKDLRILSLGILIIRIPVSDKISYLEKIKNTLYDYNIIN